jgi:hypothetical protein
MRIKLDMNLKLQEKKSTDKMKLALFKCVLKLHELSVKNCPVDTGRLKNSIIFYPSSPGATKYIVADGVDYGIDLEFGTSPHYVSPKNLESWAKRKLKNKNAAGEVANKIARFGTDAQPFFRPAMDQVRNIWVNRFLNESLK